MIRIFVPAPGLVSSWLLLRPLLALKQILTGVGCPSEMSLLFQN
jgi:hypothetical protein